MPEIKEPKAPAEIAAGAPGANSGRARAERLAAEYLRMWGLRDPRTIAQIATRWGEECERQPGCDSPVACNRAVMQRGIDETEQWLDRLALELFPADPQWRARRGLLAVEVQSHIDEFPQAMLSTAPLPEQTAESLRNAGRPVAPPSTHTAMPAQPLGEIRTPLSAVWWAALPKQLWTALLFFLRLKWFGAKSQTGGARLMLSLATLLTTAGGAWTFAASMLQRGAGWWLVILLPLFVVLFLWIAMAFWIATAGFILQLKSRPLPCDPAADDAPASPEIHSRTAILMPVYNEPPARVMAGLQAIYESVQATGHGAAFDFFILSDTTDPDLWLTEEAAYARLSQAACGPSQIFYRRRRKNTGRKAGNVADFCQRWGAAYNFMVVLDADSVMAGETVCELVRRMERDPAIGILQSPPTPVNRMSVFARCQQFAARVYGPIFLDGFAWWSGADGNYWGHNAIIRVDAFTKCCGLPKLPGEGPLAGEILSHDFVEAALMRRAGYKVCLAQDLGGSYEECPPTLIAYAQRDQRWCQGNMQHIRLAFASGFRPISRLHLGMGAMSYLSSPLWMLSLVLTFFCAAVSGEATTGEHPTGPNGAGFWGAGLFAATMVLLLAPKLWSYLVLLRDRPRMAQHGGAARAAASVGIETLVSIVVAPIMMAFHSTFVATTLLGRRVNWDAQEREEQGLSLAAAWSAHWRQMAVGTAALVATWLIAPETLPWLLPVLAGLVLVVPLSMALSSTALGRGLAKRGLLCIPEETTSTAVLERHGHLLALPTPKEISDSRGALRRLLADPALLALHRSILEATGESAPTARKPLAIIERQLLAGGAARITIDNRRAILSDPAALDALRLLAWTSQREG